MKIQLVEDWRVISRRAWSMRFTVGAAVLGGLEVAIPYLPDSVAEFVGRGTFAALAAVISAAAGIARLVDQPRMRK